MNRNILNLRHLTVLLMLCTAFLGGIIPAFAQQGGKKITGQVIDENKEPMIGVSILIEGTSTGTVTDFDGNYTLNVPQGNKELQFSYVGYETKVVPVPANSTTLNIQLKSDSQVLSDVVVIGYGTQRKSDLTGSVTNVSSKDFNMGLVSSPEQLINGKISGVQIMSNSGSPTAGSTIRVRGGASLNASNDPLIVLDGVPLEQGGISGNDGNFLSLINPNDIESMTILKDASSTAIYGSRASEGVILITTKGAGAGQSKAQPVEITYDGYYGIRKVARMPKFMESTEWMNYRFAKYTTSSGPDETGHIKYIIKDADLQSVFQNGTEWKESPLYARWMNNESYDWADQVLQTGSQQNHFISASGASEKTSYRLGAGYQGEENVFRRLGS